MLATITENQNYVKGKQLGVDKAEEAWQEYVYDALPARSQAVMENLYGMHGLAPLKAQDIAKKLKISNAAVSQHKKKIDQMLNDDSRYNLFGD
jgi:DNA-directed RNA polymerase specialized sigma subunit